MVGNALAQQRVGERGPLLRPPEEFCLPAGYRQRASNQTLDCNREDEPYWSAWRLDASERYQAHVYRWAGVLAAAHGCRSVLDAGCGVGRKLARYVATGTRAVACMDQASALAHCAAAMPRAELIEADLERPPRLGRVFDMVICADVLEHLVDPDPLVWELIGASHADTLLVLSTPERDRERGAACRSSDKPEHVREWAADEFARYLEGRGLTVVRQRLMPKDDADPWRLRRAERAYRAGRADRSPLCCQAVLARRAA